MAGTDPIDVAARPAEAGAARASTIWRQASRMMMTALVPPLCLSCRERIADYDALCPSCWRDVAFIHAPICARLGIPLNFDSGPDAISAAAAANPPPWQRARAAAHFSGPVRQLIHDFKFHDRPESRRLMARWLCGAARDILAEADVIVPIPLYRFRLAGRRFNQAAILAQEVSKLSRVPADPFLLVRRRRTPSQVGLTRNQRQANLAGAFMVPPRKTGKIAGRRVVVIDDVLTTGSTMAAAARVLRAAGASTVDVAAIAMVAETAAG